jgi:hypothetical protein
MAKKTKKGKKQNAKVNKSSQMIENERISKWIKASADDADKKFRETVLSDTKCMYKHEVQ